MVSLNSRDGFSLFNFSAKNSETICLWATFRSISVCSSVLFSLSLSLADSKSKVSSHLLILRDGKMLQFVPFSKRAWHAGISYFQGKSQCNDFSIGIELEGTDDMLYENIQYLQLANITHLLMKFYPGITIDRIVGHSDVAPGRKTDPGATFDWTYYRSLLTRPNYLPAQPSTAQEKY